MGSSIPSETRLLIEDNTRRRRRQASSTSRKDLRRGVPQAGMGCPVGAQVRQGASPLRRALRRIISPSFVSLVSLLQAPENRFDQVALIVYRLRRALCRHNKKIRIFPTGGDNQMTLA